MRATLTQPPASEPPADRLITGEELMRHPEWGPCELIRGKVVPVCRPNSQHGYLMLEIGAELRGFVKKHRLGTVVGGDSGVYLEHDPDTVRGPDVYFISAAKMPVTGIPATYEEAPPELCVEIVSPNDKPKDVREKVRQFLHLGTKLMWVIYPKSRKAKIHRADGTVSTLESDGVLSGEDVLPGFQLPLREFFAALD